MMCVRCKKRTAVVYVTRMDGEKTTNEGYCIVCAKDLSIGPIDDLIDKMGISDEELEEISDQMMDFMQVGNDSGKDFELGGTPTFPFMNNFLSAPAEEDKKTKTNKNEKSDKKDRKPPKEETKTAKRKYLDSYCSNLTQRARDNEIDRVVGRDKETYRVIQILSRRTKNNPCLIGEPGVGKTAIAEGLALRIAAGDVPARLMDKEIHLLDLTSLVAGTQFRGQFESRIKGLVDEVKSEGNIILFIDEVHNLVGTGDSEGNMNAANILKPALSRGEIQVIGATTFNEYRKNIEKDAALERRFQPVVIEEPSINDTIEMLRGIKGYYESYHRVTVSDEILISTVNLSERYINDRFLPDKAIDLLDESCSHSSLRNKQAAIYDVTINKINELKSKEESLMILPEDIDYEELAKIRAEIIKLETKAEDLRPSALENEVLQSDIAKVIELWTGIPASKVQQNELKKLASLEENLQKKIIGQDDAIHAIAAAIRRSRLQISSRRRPASFIFVGPTGVGKTELAKVLSKELFDTPETLIRLDMSEFMEKHSVARIIGSPPGYVGYDEAGQLTEKVRRKPYSVLLFDEIEKAHPDVLNILLQILDEGKISDAHGRTVNFENTIIIMTSNAGSQKEGVLGFGKTTEEANKEKNLRALNEFLKPEFISRVDESIVFRPLNEEDLKKITTLMLQELKIPLDERNIIFLWDSASVELLAKKASNGKKGARELRNIIRREVEDKIAAVLIDNCDEEPAGIKLLGGEELKLIVL